MHHGHSCPQVPHNSGGEEYEEPYEVGKRHRNSPKISRKYVSSSWKKTYCGFLVGETKIWNPSYNMPVTQVLPPGQSLRRSIRM